MSRRRSRGKQSTRPATPADTDATLVSPLKATGEPRPGALRRPGLALRTAARTKRNTTYPELKSSPVLSLVVAASEVGGKLNREAKDLLDAAAAHKAQVLEPRNVEYLPASHRIQGWSPIIMDESDHEDDRRLRARFGPFQERMTQWRLTAREGSINLVWTFTIKI